MISRNKSILSAGIDSVQNFTPENYTEISFLLKQFLSNIRDVKKQSGFLNAWCIVISPTWEVNNGDDFAFLFSNFDFWFLIFSEVYGSRPKNGHVTLCLSWFCVHFFVNVSKGNLWVNLKFFLIFQISIVAILR